MIMMKPGHTELFLNTTIKSLWLQKNIGIFCAFKALYQELFAYLTLRFRVGTAPLSQKNLLKDMQIVYMALEENVL